MVAARERSADRQDHPGPPGASWAGVAAVSRSGGKAAGCDLQRCQHVPQGNHTGDDITAKDFRTWAGTVLAAMALHEVKNFDSAAEAKRNLRTAIENVAARLGNTPTICRKC